MRSMMTKTLTCATAHAVERHFMCGRSCQNKFHDESLKTDFPIDLLITQNRMKMGRSRPFHVHFSLDRPIFHAIHSQRGQEGLRLNQHY